MQEVFQGSIPQGVSELCRRAAISQAGLARKIEINQNNISDWMSGGSNPKSENLLKVALIAKPWPDLFWFFVERAGLYQGAVLDVQAIEAGRPAAVAHRIPAGVERRWTSSEKNRKVK